MTVVRGAVHRNSYRDSVELMGIAAQLEQLAGVQRAGLVMATPANLAVLAEAGTEPGFITALLDPEESAVVRNRIPALANERSFAPPATGPARLKTAS